MKELKLNDIFDNTYRLMEQVGIGGFAEVWQAEFLQAHKVVALKIFPVMDTRGIEVVEAEYKNQVDLAHTYLLQARHFGVYENRPYLQMRFCDGGNAANKIGNYTEREIAQCICQVGSALDYLHQNEIVHQDVKPNNFLIDQGRYYLSDLGLSIKMRKTIPQYTSSMGNHVPGNHQITTSGQAPPPYRAPETWKKDSPLVTNIAATDIWAFSAALYEMMAGEVPFGEFGGLVQINDPQPPDLPKKYSQGLNELIKKGLSISVADRPSAAEMVEAAELYLQTGSYTGKIAHKPVNWKMIVAAVILLVVVAAGLFWYMHRTGNKNVINSGGTTGAKNATIAKGGTNEFKKPPVVIKPPPVLLKKPNHHNKKIDPFHQKEQEKSVSDK